MQESQQGSQLETGQAGQGAAQGHAGAQGAITGAKHGHDEWQGHAANA